ncbi:uncharacterized protein UTRI_02825_B [Ustilago trichophora]|uniref:Uncharacterized protein n=1 Tax=Ustilago trichophora TaxID=86804 RepID=A0A5C3E674_9BASI|nr:uncharacterized protein UTRI_02825_B [Ustilago trichophora]
MSTLEGAVPLGLGITKLRLWDELHRAHCETLESFRHSSSSPHGEYRGRNETSIEMARCQTAGPDLENKPSTHVTRPAPHPAATSCALGAKKRRLTEHRLTQGGNSAARTGCNVSSLDYDLHCSSQPSFSDWFLSNCRRDSLSQAQNDMATSKTRTGVESDSQGVQMPPPPQKPGPSGRRPPPLVARIKAKARRAKRKQQKAEYRRRLFLAHMVQATREARKGNSISTAALAMSSGGAPSTSARDMRSARNVSVQRECTPALSLFPERLGVDLSSFVEVVFDTDAQSSEITAPSDISDDDLARATRTEIETRKTLEGADAVVPKGVFRWMVSRDFADRWPQKVQGVRKNPWPGLEEVWGLPSNVAPGEAVKSEVGPSKPPRRQEVREEEPVRWQSGRRSRFIRRKEKAAPPSKVTIGVTEAHSLAANISGGPVSHQSSLSTPALLNVPEVEAVQATVPLLLPSTQATTYRADFVAPQRSVPIVLGPYAADLGGKLAGTGAHLNPCAEWTDLSFGLADSILNPLDWSGAMACSHPAAFASAVAGVPIHL